MSKLAVHVQHFKKASVGGIGSHNFYKRGEKDKHSNQDIDPARSSENVLFVAPDKNLYQDVKNLVESSTGRVTANSIWVSEWIVYPPENLQDPKTADKEQVLQYFGDVREWMQEQGFVIPMATIHFDESTVHGHFDTVPLTEDGRLSRKDIYTRTRLNNIHTELAKHLQAKGWDIQRGDSTKDKQVKSKSVVEYKKQAEAEKKQLLEEIEVLKDVAATHEEIIAVYQEQASEAFAAATVAEEKSQELQEQVTALTDQKAALEADIELMKSVLTPEQIEAIKTEKTLFGSVKISGKEYEALKNTALTAERATDERDQALAMAAKADQRADDALERAEMYIKSANKQLQEKVDDVNQQLQEKMREIENTHPDIQLQLLNRQLRQAAEAAEEKRKAAQEALDRLKYNFSYAAQFIKDVAEAVREQPELQRELQKKTKPPVKEMVLYTNVELQRTIDKACGTSFARQIDIRQRLNYFERIDKEYGLSMNQVQERIALTRELRELTGENYKAPVQQRGNNSRDER